MLDQGWAMYDDYVYRLKTFKNWKYEDVVPAHELAAANFHVPLKSYEEIPPDCVLCHTCKIYLSKWDKGEDPLKAHFVHSPKCKFVKKKSCCAESCQLLIRTGPCSNCKNDDYCRCRCVTFVLKLISEMGWSGKLSRKLHCCEKQCKEIEYNKCGKCYCKCGCKTWEEKRNV